MEKTLLLVVLLTIVFACGTQDTNVSQIETGSIILRAQFPNNGENYRTRAAPPGVVTVRIIVSGPGMKSMRADFDATLNSGTIAKVPAGSGRMATVQGLDDTGRLTHSGSSGKFAVEAGKTTDVGTVQLAVAADGLWDRSRWEHALWGP